MTTVTTTLQAIRDASPFLRGYRKLREHLGRDWPMDKQFNVLRVLRSNGNIDAMWVLLRAAGAKGLDVLERFLEADWAAAFESGNTAKGLDDLLRRLLAPTPKRAKARKRRAA